MNPRPQRIFKLFNMSKQCDTICLNRPTTTTKGTVKRETLNKNLCIDLSTANTHRPIIIYFWNSNSIRNREKAFLKKNAIMHLNRFSLTCHKTPRMP